MTLRTYSDGDFDQVLEVLNDRALTLFGEPSYSAEELRRWLTWPSLDVARDIRVVEQDDRVVGYVDVYVQKDDPPKYWSDARPRSDVAASVFPQLLDWAEERSSDGILRAWCFAQAEDERREFEARGYKTIRHSFRMSIALDGDVAVPEPPEGIELRTVRDGEQRTVHAGHVEAFLDSWEPFDEGYDAWAHDMLGEGCDLSLWFLAWDGDELAGYVLCRVSDTAEDTGWIGLLGVRRPYRRRGLGETLLKHAFREFRARGLAKAALGVDAGSPTGATRLYERVGMSVYRETVIYERPGA